MEGQIKAVFGGLTVIPQRSRKTEYKRYLLGLKPNDKARPKVPKLSQDPRMIAKYASALVTFASQFGDRPSNSIMTGIFEDENGTQFDLTDNEEGLRLRDFIDAATKILKFALVNRLDDRRKSIRATVSRSCNVNQSSIFLTTCE